MSPSLDYVVNSGIHIAGYLRSVKKSADVLCPLQEAISNSWEAFEASSQNRVIKVSILRPGKDLNGEAYGQTSISILDNGSGFTADSYLRFSDLHDDTKSKSNKGTGRLQFIKFFETVIIESVYIENGIKHRRDIEFSARKDFLYQNALIKTREPNETDEPVHTKIELKGFIDENDNRNFNHLSLTKIRDQIIKRFIVKGAIESIIPTIYISDSVIDDKPVKIDKNSFPALYRSDIARIPIFDSNQKAVGTWEDVSIKSYLFSAKELEQNIIYVASKGETVQTIPITCFKTTDTIISNKRIIFVVEGSVIDRNVSEDRESVLCPRKMQPELFCEWPNIYFEDLIEIVNDKIKENYPEILTSFEKHQERVKELQEAFNLDPEILKDTPVNVNDANSVLLEKVYKKEAKKQALLDSSLFEKKQEIKYLDSRSGDFQKQVEGLASEISKLIPQQNKELLSKYVSHRRIVLEMIRGVLEKSLDAQKEVRNEDEKIIHDILFRQKSSNPVESNLWVLDDSYLYFKGCSDLKLKDITIDGKKVFLDKIEEEENEYYRQSKENKRPDVLLFPAEGKCIILEFKNPKIDVATQVFQPRQYATWILSYCTEAFCFDKFYAYLIGEEFKLTDLRTVDSNFKTSAAFDFAYLINHPIADVSGKNRKDGSLYMEVIRYSSIVERSEARNKAFFDRLFKGEEKII